MNNSSLIQVKVQDLNEDKKVVKQRRLIYQKIKPFMEAYGLRADLFELKGKQVVFKANNSINTSQLSRSGVTSKSVILANKARKISVKKKNQNQQRQIIAPMDYSPLTISEKYAQLFAELQSHPEHTKAASAVQPSSIPEEADEITDNSTIKKQVLSEIAELDQIKQQKLEELQNLEQKIQDLQGLEHNILSNRQFVIRQPTLRQKKDKAASLIQAHIKGRIDQRRYQEWKQHKQQKLDKLTKIQKWWKLILRRKLISKKLQLTHVNKQIKEIGGCTFIVFSNYSHPLKRIRILLIQRNGLIKQNYRFYLNFDNIQNILTEQPQISSFEFNNLLDVITSNLFKIFQIHNNQIVMDLISKNNFYIERLLLSINITLSQLQHDQYGININQQDEEEEVQQEENSHNLEENFEEKQSEEWKEQLQADDQEVKQLSAIENVQISEAEAIQEQQLSYQYDQEIENKKFNENQEDLREQIQINDPLIDNHQSQLSDTKPDNEEQLEYVTENYQIDQQIKESPKQEKQHQFREESINSEFIESNFQLVNVKKEIAEFDIQQQNQSNDEQDNRKEDEKPNEQEIYEVPQIQEQNENLKESFVQEEHKSERKESCQEDIEQIDKVIQQEFVESSDNQRIPVDQQVDLIVQQNNEIPLEQEKQDNQMIIKLEYVGENNSENQVQNNENTSQIIPEFTSVPRSPEVEFQKQCIPLSIPNSELQLLKSCNSNFDPPVQEINKMLNSNELLLKSENQFTVFKQNDRELNQLLQSEELQRDFSFPAPVVLRHQQQSRKSSTQIQELPEQQSPSAESRANSEFKKSQTEEIFKQSVGTTFRVTFNSEFRASVSGFFQSQQFDLTIKQQDSLQYSMDESQEIAPIFITTVQLDEDEIDVYQINDKLRFQDKKGKYNHYDYKIQTISQSNCDYINNQLYIYAINNSLKCLEGCQVLRIQKFVMKYSFVQSCYLIVDNKSYLALLYKSCNIKQIFRFKNENRNTLWKQPYQGDHFKQLHKRITIRDQVVFSSHMPTPPNSRIQFQGFHNFPHRVIKKQLKKIYALLQIIKLMIIEFILLQVAISQKCTTFNNDTLEIYATQNEIIKMSFSEIFLEKDYSNITIENGLGLLSITQPISQLEQKLFDSINMKSFSLLTNELSYEWLNKFAALIYTNNQYIIQLSQQNNQGQNGRMPDFSTMSQPINVDFCFDAVFVSKSIIAVDCMNTETNGGIQNIYYLWNDIHKNFTAVENDNFKGYTKDIKRKSLAAYQQIYRASLYNVDHSEYDSVLEVFSSDGKLSHFLDSDYLTSLLSFQYQLQILDFKVSNLGQVAILNNNNDILVLNYSVREKAWKLLHRFEHNGQVKAFDFNFKVGTYLVYYDNFLLYQSKTSQFQFQISNITSVYLTNQRILAQNNDQIFLFDQILNLIQTQQIESINFIINDHTKDDLLLFNKQKIIRYYLYEDYYLTYQNFDTDSVEQFSYIKQTLPNQIVCQFQLIHSTVSTHNEVLFVSQKNGNIIDEFIPTYPSNYSLKFNKHSVYGTNLQYQFSQIKNKGEMLDITPKSYEKYNIQFHETDKQSFIYLLDSESDIYLIIQYESNLMEIQICSKQLECKVELQNMIDFQLNEQNSCFWVGSKALFIAFYYENIISISYLKNSSLNQLFEIPYEFEVDRLLYNGIFLIFSKSEMIITAYYISTVGYLKQYTLNSQSISDLGISDWQPNKVFSVHSNNHIYILNKETDLIVISCTLLEYKILDRINFSQPIENVLAFTKNFIVSFNTELHVYDTNNEADFYYSKIIPLFGYQIQKIASYTAQGWIYIVTNQQQLLIININNLNVNSLLNVLPINNINLISATQDYVFVDNCIFKQYHKVNLISNAEIYSTNLFNKIDLQVQISNPKSQYFAHFNQTIQNQQTSVRIDESKLTLQKTLDQKSQENYCQQLSNDFFQNTVNKLEIQCPDCGKEIELKENIQFTFSIENGLDFNGIGIDRLIILNAQNFLIFSNNQQLIMNISFVDQNVNCSKIMYADESIILLKCADDFLIQWKYDNDKYIFEQKLESQPDLSSVQLIDNALFLISPNIVELYQNNTKIEKWEIDGRVLKIHKINSFFHIYYQDSQISIIEFQIISGVVLETQTIVIDLNQLFINYQFNHRWLNLYIQGQSENKNLFNADYLLVAEAGVHFVFNFLFNCTNLCKLEESRINNIIQNYGDWVAQDSKNYDNWFGVLYQKEEQQTLSIYQIPSSWNNQNAVTQIGALTLKELSQFNFINQNNQVILGTINNATLSFFSLNKQRQLCMNGKIEKQSVLLIASNDFSQQQYTFQIDIKYNYYKFWGLWLFIAVILIGLGIGIWCWKKRKNAKKDLLLLE